MIKSFFSTPWPYIEVAACIGACASLIGGIIARKGSRSGTWSPTKQRIGWALLLLATQAVFLGLNVVSSLLGR